MSKNNQYVVSPITTYDEWEMLWETKVGIDNQELSLHYSVWGKSDLTSRLRAINLANLLNGLGE